MANHASTTNRPKGKAPPPDDDSPRPPRKAPWLPALLVLVGVAAAAAALYSPADEPRGEQDAWTSTENLQAARVEGRAAHYHLTFADFARWHIEKDPPKEPGKEPDLWLTYGHEDAHMVAMVMPIDSPDLERTADLILESSRKAFSSFTEIERTPLTDRADRGLLIHLRVVQNDTTFELVKGYFKDEGAIYEITAMAAPPSFARLRRELEAVVRSFELPRR